MNNPNDFQISLMTNVTREAFGLPTVIKHDRSIHWNPFNKKSSPSTKAPRQRSGLKNNPHNKFAGGKTLRKALAKLEMNREWRDKIIAEGSKDKPGISLTFSNIPGSMKG